MLAQKSAVTGLSAVVSQIEHLLTTERQGKQQGAELVFLCLVHSEARPSANWNSEKLTWICRSGSSPECSAGGGWKDMARRLRIELPSNTGSRWVEEGRWIVRELDGTPVRVPHIRYRKPNGDKTYVWGEKDQGGLDGRPVNDLPLYGSELIKDFDKHSLIVLVEGEKCADALRSLGFQALGTVTGAGTTPSKEVLSCLEPFDVSLWADNDKPGRAHMERIERLLSEPPLILNWSEAPEKGDCADFVEQGGTKEQVEILLSEAEIRPSTFPSEVVVPLSPPSGGKEKGTTSDLPIISAGILDATAILAYTPPAIQWQWEGRLPVGGLCLLASKPKIGKTQLLVGLALATSRGNNFLGWRTKSGPVLYLAFEGHKRDVTDRLKNMGLRSDDEVHLRVGPPPVLDDRDKTIFDDWLEPLIDEIKPVLVIIDTLFRMLPGVVDANDYSIVNRALAPLEYLARRTEVTFLVSHHSNKSTDNSDDPGAGILGSTAILGGIDTALLMRRRKGAEGVSPGRELLSIQREGESLEPIVVSLDESGWPTNGGRAEDFAIEAAKQRIWEVLSEADAGELGAGALQELVGGKRDVYGSARRSMLDSGEMHIRSEGKKKYYFLSGSGASSW